MFCAAKIAASRFCRACCFAKQAGHFFAQLCPCPQVFAFVRPSCTKNTLPQYNENRKVSKRVIIYLQKIFPQCLKFA